MSIFNFLRSSFNEKKMLDGLSNEEYSRLKTYPRFTPTNTILFGNKISMPDVPTFLSSFDEIFNKEVYKFIGNDKNITMLDCGANIGLATLYIKRKFPNSHIISFEPDPQIFNALQENVINQKLSNVEVRNEAISNKETKLNFYLEGGHSGMIVENNLSEKVIEVNAVRLKDVMMQFNEITFLKIDIEGHEKIVIPDIASELGKVKYLFFEYHSIMDEVQTLDELLRVVRDAGMKYYIKESVNKQFPFVDREIFLKMDLILNIFCYRD